MSAIDDLISEADRQLTICNACRYCEGYCAVFPTLARRRELSPDEVIHLSNLCHDCRACYYACMYAPPHEFAVNPPQVLAKVRVHSYDRYLGPAAKRVRRHVGGVGAAALLAVLSLLLVGGVAAATEGWHGIFGTHRSGSPYAVIDYAALLPVALVPFLASCWAMARSAGRYWVATHGPLRTLWNLPAQREAAAAAGGLRYLRGGGGECFYPEDVPSPARRRIHAAVAYGFTLCLVATVAAGIMQDGAGWQPPYGIVSLPVLCGLLGGIGLVVGSTGLVVLKVREDRVPADAAYFGAECGFLLALDILGVTGLLALLLRHDAGFGVVLVLHLTAVVACFVYAPYTKFVHFIYRYLALVKDAIETRADAASEPSEAESVRASAPV